MRDARVTDLLMMRDAGMAMPEDVDRCLTEIERLNDQAAKVRKLSLALYTETTNPAIERAKSGSVMGPITQAIDAMRKAIQAFREHGLLTDEECIVCRRIVEGGVHVEDCPILGLHHAERRLAEFSAEITG